MNAMLINLSLFKAGWLAAVFAAAASLPILGTAIIGIAVAVHLLRSDAPRDEFLLLALAAATGFVWESLLVYTGIVQYGANAAFAGIAPYWIVAMWVLFATTLNVGMRWLRKNLLVASLFGALGGPMSFLAGEKAGAVSFSNASTALVIIGLGWAVLLPLLVRYAARSDKRVAAAA
ncbi:MAG: DUF2878 domain-containing protein [Gammaproteobacteria bacterium]|jgi:hypothetical protein|nr:DUF2878 domain-containing protein [Gammaproteobacteria bacterium]